MFNELKIIGFVVIDGINHYIFSRNNNDLYLINGLNGSATKVDKVDLHHPVGTPNIVDKSISLLDSRLNLIDKVEKTVAVYDLVGKDEV